MKIARSVLLACLRATCVPPSYTSNIGVKTYLLGYAREGVKFFTNRIAKSTALTDVWTDVDISVDTGADTAFVDASEKAQQKIESTNLDLYLTQVRDLRRRLFHQRRPKVRHDHR